uniref:Uncharacterized protein n=1 Tax=Anguilla anguilla TaxID=7936 RepID=A0A0E9UK08_ANGAN
MITARWRGVCLWWFCTLRNGSFREC